MQSLPHLTKNQWWISSRQDASAPKTSWYRCMRQAGARQYGHPTHVEVGISHGQNFRPGHGSRRKQRRAQHIVDWSKCEQYCPYSSHDHSAFLRCLSTCRKLPFASDNRSQHRPLRLACKKSFGSEIWVKCRIVEPHKASQIGVTGSAGKPWIGTHLCECNGLPWHVTWINCQFKLLSLALKNLRRWKQPWEGGHSRDVLPDSDDVGE